MKYTLMKGWPLCFSELSEGKKFIALPIGESGKSSFLLLLKLQKGEGKNGENAVRVNDGILIKLTPQTQVVPIEVDR